MNANSHTDPAGPHSGRRALITGATAGIGFHIADALAPAARPSR
jgi:NAD(P)-dependent dehydrogenase (short-subunit alcohol dehydrogenase family)